MDKQISVEEAIKYLCMIPIPFISGNRDCDTEESQKYSIALSMAIESIRDMEEIYEIMNCDVYGEFDAKIKFKMISNIIYSKPHYFKPEDAITRLPSINSQPKTGHWIYKIYGGFHEQGNWYCSHCDYQYNYGNGHAKFCPECGYEMSEPSTEEVIGDKDYDWIIKR